MVIKTDTPRTPRMMSRTTETIVDVTICQVFSIESEPSTLSRSIVK